MARSIGSDERIANLRQKVKDLEVSRVEISEALFHLLDDVREAAKPFVLMAEGMRGLENESIVPFRHSLAWKPPVILTAGDFRKLAEAVKPLEGTWDLEAE